MSASDFDRSGPPLRGTRLHLPGPISTKRPWAGRQRSNHRPFAPAI